MEAQSHLRYSSDLDRLRGIAILCVVFYHLDLRVLTSGFLGVDVFFVISGFLVARPIFLERAFGAQQVISFFARRVRRIFPPLFFMVAVSTLFFRFFVPFLPESYPRSVLSALTFWANGFFYLQVDYFDTSSTTQPLLHIWSLAVEEQFYLGLPVLLVLIFGRQLRTKYIVIAATAVLSFVLAILAANSAAAFYLPHYRAWEFLIGVGLALRSSQLPAMIVRPLSRSILQSSSVSVILTVCHFAETWGLTRLMSVIIVTVASALFISVASFQADQKSDKFRPLVIVGKMSYSLYLWHYPIFVVADLTLPSHLGLLASLSITILASSFSYWFVERPSKLRYLGRDVQAIASGLVLVVLATPTVFLLADGARDVPNTKTDPSYVMNSLSPPTQPSAIRLDRDQASNSPSSMRRIAVVGDSFAMALGPSGGKLEKHAIFLTTGDCFMNNVFDFDHKECRGVSERLSHELAGALPQVVLLHFRWTDRPHFAEALSKLISVVRESTPSSKIVLLGSVPTWDKVGGVPLPYKILSNWDSIRWLNSKGYLRQPQDRAAVEIEVDQQLKTIAVASNVSLVLPRQSMCLPIGCLAVVSTPQGFYSTSWDYGHLTKSGADAIWSYQLSDLPFSRNS